MSTTDTEPDLSQFLKERRVITWPPECDRPLPSRKSKESKRDSLHSNPDSEAEDGHTEADVESGRLVDEDLKEMPKLKWTKMRSRSDYTSKSSASLAEPVNLEEYLKASRKSELGGGCSVATSESPSRPSEAGASNLKSQRPTTIRDTRVPSQGINRSSTFPASGAESRQRRARDGKGVFDLYDTSDGEDSD